MGDDKQRVRCGGCGAELSEPPAGLTDNRPSCPSCGSKARVLDKTLNVCVTTSVHIAAVQERNNEAVGYSESERRGAASASTLQPDGRLEISIRGSSPQGEADTLATCRVLLDRLRAEGASFTDVRAGDGPADCILSARDDPGEDAPVQVVRAIVSHELWKKLADTDTTYRELDVADRINELLRAISHKATDVKLPQCQRAGLILALDATRLPGLAFDAVIREFRSSHTEWVSSLGFKAVWLVGPDWRLTWRLDAS